MTPRSWRRALLCLLLPCLFLSGCSPSVPLKDKQPAALPAPAIKNAAPEGDVGKEFAQSILLCLPESSDGQLKLHSERIPVPPYRHPAEATLKKLLAFQPTDTLLSLGGETPLRLATGSGVEISGTVATINLAADALLLDRRDFFMASRAIANTLTQWSDISYVNILVSGQHPGIDTASTLPAGCLQRTDSGDLRTLWENITAQTARTPDNLDTQRFSSVAALYFPVAAGRGVVAEARLISFPGQTQAQMVRSLLASLSDGAQSLPAVPPVPNLISCLTANPLVEERPSTQGRVVRLSFDESLNELLIVAGIPRSVMMASLTLTITTFIPACSGIEVTIGNERIAAVVPAGIYEGAGLEITFAEGLMRRVDFSAFILNYCSLYFSDEDGALVRVLRPVPYYQTRHICFLLQQLMEGPQSHDSIAGMKPVLPSGMRDADLIGLSREGDEVLLNFSQALLTRSHGLSAKEERLMIYAIVNTVTEIPQAARVRFYVMGTQPESLGGAIYLPGAFMRNPGIVRLP